MMWSYALIKWPKCNEVLYKKIYTNKEQLMIRQPYDKYLLNNFFTAEGLFCTPPGARRINWQRGWRRRALSRNGIHIFINKTKRKRNGTTLL